VYALDLLASGQRQPRSRLKDEPQLAGSCATAFDLWATQGVPTSSASLEAESAPGAPALLGNSIGGLVSPRGLPGALRVAYRPTQGDPDRLCPRTLDEKRIAKLPAL